MTANDSTPEEGESPAGVSEDVQIAVRILLRQEVAAARDQVTDVLDRVDAADPPGSQSVGQLRTASDRLERLAEIVALLDGESTARREVLAPAHDVSNPPNGSDS